VLCELPNVPELPRLRAQGRTGAGEALFTAIPRVLSLLGGPSFGRVVGPIGRVFALCFFGAQIAIFWVMNMDFGNNGVISVGYKYSIFFLLSDFSLDRLLGASDMAIGMALYYQLSYPCFYRRKLSAKHRGRWI